MSNFTDFISGGGSASFPTIFLSKSQTWIPPQDGNIMIHVIGAGGSGSATRRSYQIQSGAAGGYCRKNSLSVTTSGSFTVVVGAGGASRLGSEGAGTAGGTTSVAGTGLSSTLTATGGAGGALSNGQYTTGGTASNGDVNNAGGRGGYQIGGGAVGLSGTGLDGFKLGSGETWSHGAFCDVLGDFYSSTFGQLSGGKGGMGFSGYSRLNQHCRAEPLAGGGGVVRDTTYGNVAQAGHASIGGGGGFCYALNLTTHQFSGRGGEGCVVIQYIP